MLPSSARKSKLSLLTILPVMVLVAGKQTGTQQGNNLEKSFHQVMLILGRLESYLAHLLPRSRCPGNPPVLGLCLLVGW